MMSARSCWKVIGGADKGGILVRETHATSSPQLADRLATGALIQELELVGDRLRYVKLEGGGPETGWVSVKLKDKQLLGPHVDDVEAVAEQSTTDVLTIEARVESVANKLATDVPPVGEAEVTQGPQGDADNVDADKEPLLPPPRKYEGGDLPAIPRGDRKMCWLPKLYDMSASVIKRLQEEEKKRTPKRRPKVRMFVFYGVADAAADWMRFIIKAPLWSDVAVYECRGHGVREGELFDKNLEERLEDAWNALYPALTQHASGGEIEGAPFAFLGHSSGSQLLCLVARRARWKLGLEPAIVFIQDRPPPHIKAISDVGYELLCNNPSEFFRHFSPTVHDYFRTKDTNPIAKGLVDKWSTGMLTTQGHHCRQGYHIFHCPIHYFIAMAVFGQDLAFAEGKMSPEQSESHLRRDKVVQSVPNSAADWDVAQYELWKTWTTGECVERQVATDHSSLRFNDDCQDAIWAALKTIAFA